MNLKWRTGAELNYNFPWTLYDCAPNASNPFKAIIDWPRPGKYSVWNDETGIWREVNLPREMTLEEEQAFLLWEYRTQ